MDEIKIEVESLTTEQWGTITREIARIMNDTNKFHRIICHRPDCSPLRGW